MFMARKGGEITRHVNIGRYENVNIGRYEKVFPRKRDV